MSCLSPGPAQRPQHPRHDQLRDLARAEQALLEALRRRVRPPRAGVALRVLPGRRGGSACSRGCATPTLHPRRGLAVHPARQVPRARRQDPAHPRRAVPPAAGADQPRRPAAVEPALGGGAQELPRLRGVPAAHVGRVDPERVVEFLLLHPPFPRSVRFCLEARPRRWRRSRDGAAGARAERGRPRSWG